MDVSDADSERQALDRSMPTALLECLAAMRIGAETALEIEFAEHGENGIERMESHE